jgi:hypothetical protein
MTEAPGAQPAEPQPTPPTGVPTEQPTVPSTPQVTAQQPPYGGGQQPNPYGGYPAAPYGGGPAGKVRGTGAAILLTIVTLGFYSLYWFYAVHDEMKRHRGTGIGGGVAFLLAFFVGIVMPYLTSSEVGELYAARGEEKPVTGLTGLWYFPGMLILVGPIVWFVKTNGALNRYWRSVAAA